MVKLTEAQRRTLEALPCSITTLGGKPFTGVRNRSTLWALHKADLATITYRGSTETWRITEAGRRALSEQEQGR